MHHFTNRHNLGVCIENEVEKVYFLDPDINFIIVRSYNFYCISLKNIVLLLMNVIKSYKIYRCKYATFSVGQLFATATRFAKQSGGLYFFH